VEGLLRSTLKKLAFEEDLERMITEGVEKEEI
jgi:hypothetical protein